MNHLNIKMYLKVVLLIIIINTIIHSKPIDCGLVLQSQICPETYLDVWLMDKKLYNIGDLIVEMEKNEEMTKSLNGIRMLKSTQRTVSGIGMTLIYGGVMAACVGVVAAANSSNSAMDFLKYGGLTAVGGFNLMILSFPLEMVTRNKTIKAIKKFNLLQK
jgi:hypothetical protein